MSLCSVAALRTDAPSSHQHAAPESLGETAAWNLCEGSSPGPLAVCWMLQQVLKASARQDAPFWCRQIDACKHAARVGQRCAAAGRPTAWFPTRSACIGATFATLFCPDTTASLICSALSVLCSAYSAPVPTRRCSRSLLLALPGDLRRARATLWAVREGRGASAVTLRAAGFDQ